MGDTDGYDTRYLREQLIGQLLASYGSTKTAEELIDLAEVLERYITEGRPARTEA